MALIPAWLVAFMFFIAFFVKIKKREYEHALTRFLIFMLYGYFAFNLNMNLVNSQILARWLYMLLCIIEIISYITRKAVDHAKR
jgi:hypothetical protein